MGRLMEQMCDLEIGWVINNCRLQVGIWAILTSKGLVALCAFKQSLNV